MLYADNPFWIRKFSEQVVSNAYVSNRTNHPVLMEIILRILEEMSMKRHYYREYVKSLIVPLLVEINRMNQEKKEAVIPNPQVTNILANAIEYIGTHYMEDIKIQDLAVISHMSESHFRRVFQDIVGMKPLDYINTVRVRMSCAMLRSTDDSVAEIATRCGFPAISTYNRNFLRVMATTPLKWRKDPEGQRKELKNYEIKTLYGWLE